MGHWEYVFDKDGYHCDKHSCYDTGLHSGEDCLNMGCEHCYSPTYIDECGGRHKEGKGWNPNGNYCGDCEKMNCKGCSMEYV